MTTLLLPLVAAGLVGLAVDVMMRLDRASRVASPSGALSRRHGRHSQLQRDDPASPALFILSAVLVLLVVAALV